jgi:tetratricopeptide (TPR) repeat protein
VLVGAGLGMITFLGVVLTAFLPVPQIPDTAIQQYAQGYGYTWQGRYDEAIQAYNQALAIYPDYANALAQRGQAWFHTRPPEIKNAIQDLEAASQRASDKYNVFWNLGWAYYLAGEYSKSIQASQKALGLNSQICGPAFNVAIARLAMGEPAQAEKEYEAAITRCEKILQDSLAVGLAAPYTLWDEIEASAEDIENLLCQTHQRHCYPDREQHDVRNVVNRDAVLVTGEKYLKRIKEALTALEYLHTATVKPGGARFGSQVFGNKFYNDAGEFQAYVYHDRFPSTGASIYAAWDYSGVKSGIRTVWKVYFNGSEESGLRYDYNWDLADTGSAVKRIDSWWDLAPGRYDVEVYGDGELLATGTFVIDDQKTLAPPPPVDIRPTAPVNVGDLIFYDDLVNNIRGWWSSSGSLAEGTAKNAVIENGEYRMVDHKKDTVWRVTCEACGSYDDFYYEATARYVSGPNNYGYGLAFRGDRGMDQMYLFQIDELGSYKIAKVVDDKYTSVTSWTRSSLIHPNAPNRLGVLTRGSSFEFFINGQSVTRITDTSLAKGYLGFTVETSELKVGFSQVRAWQVK